MQNNTLSTAHKPSFVGNIAACKKSLAMGAMKPPRNTSTTTIEITSDHDPKFDLDTIRAKVKAALTAGRIIAEQGDAHKAANVLQNASDWCDELPEEEQPAIRKAIDEIVSIYAGSKRLW